MKNTPLMTAVAVAIAASASIAQDRPAGLTDLDAMTFACPKAGLNLAAREAAKVKSQGTYQFSYFKIINDSHHSAYEIHFKSNFEGEPDLKYCVALYCQQGWDPTTTKAEVTRIGTARQSARMPAHANDCREQPAARAKIRAR